MNVLPLSVAKYNWGGESSSTSNFIVSELTGFSPLMKLTEQNIFFPFLMQPWVGGSPDMTFRFSATSDPTVIRHSRDAIKKSGDAAGVLLEIKNKMA